MTDRICDQKVPPPDCAKRGGSLLVVTKRKNCLLAMVPEDEDLPDAEWEDAFNIVALQLVEDYTNLQQLPFSVTHAAANAALVAQDNGYHLRGTMVAPHESMGYAGAGSVWYQSNVATRQIGDGGAEVEGPRLAVAFLPPAV